MVTEGHFSGATFVTYGALQETHTVPFVTMNGSVLSLPKWYHFVSKNSNIMRARVCSLNSKWYS
jgi:hypothetical protein